MNILTRLALALCTAGLAGLMVPGIALAQTLSTSDPQVCCARTDAAGNRTYFKAPKSQCTKPLQIVADARCKPTLERRICCRTPNGFFFMPASQCKTPAHPDRCKQKPVCCKKPGGYDTVPSPARCRALGGTVVPDAVCKRLPPQKRVCCMRKGPNGPVFGFTNAQRCKASGGQIVGDGRCRPAGRICCRIKRPGATPIHILTDPRTCKRKHGQKVPVRYCRRVLNPTLRSPG